MVPYRIGSRLLPGLASATMLADLARGFLRFPSRECGELPGHFPGSASQARYSLGFGPELDEFEYISALVAPVLSDRQITYLRSTHAARLWQL
jgi:hypothetical protein